MRRVGEEGRCHPVLTRSLAANGCLRVCKGAWGPTNAVECIAPQGDPEVGGRAGGIVPHVADALTWESVECAAGDVFFFNGYLPHRSGVNTTTQPRRAVFFTYNRLSDGDFRTQYYHNLNTIRAQWKERLVRELQCDYASDLAAFNSVPQGSGFDASRYAAGLARLASRAVDSSQEDSEVVEQPLDTLF